MQQMDASAALRQQAMVTVSNPFLGIVTMVNHILDTHTLTVPLRPSAVVFDCHCLRAGAVELHFCTDMCPVHP